jgi:hypothetical protein
VQRNGGNPTFGTYGCYAGNNVGGTLISLTPFSSATFTAYIDSSNIMRLEMTNVKVNGVDSADQAYSCGPAPAGLGTGIGIAGDHIWTLTGTGVASKTFALLADSQRLKVT